MTEETGFRIVDFVRWQGVKKRKTRSVQLVRECFSLFCNADSGQKMQL
jgi:hypothetical protein